MIKTINADAISTKSVNLNKYRAVFINGCDIISDIIFLAKSGAEARERIPFIAPSDWKGRTLQLSMVL